MSTAGNEILEFQCPKCGKKLKANRQLAGKRLKCPQCLQPVQLPHDPVSASTTPTSNSGDDWLNLDLGAEFDNSPNSREVSASKSSSVAAQTTQPNSGTTAGRPASTPNRPASSPPQPAMPPKPSATELQKQGQASPSSSTNTSVSASAQRPPSSGSSDRRRDAGTAQPNNNRSGNESVPATSQAPVPTTSSGGTAPPRTVFDDDLPDLSATNIESLDSGLEASSVTPSKKTGGQARRAAASHDGDPLGLANIVGEEFESPPEYRIICKNCGTAQYVRQNKQGQRIQCPDCYIDFVVPGPPPNWQPVKAKLKVNRDEGPDVKLAPAESVAAMEASVQDKARAVAILERARRELDDEIDELYEPDFDTKGFIERTFGFAMGAVGALQLVFYGLLFGIFFATIQFSAIQFSQGERGFVFLVPIVATAAVLISMPMLSGGIVLIETVANGRKKVLDWPNFNLFDNFSDILLIGSALVASMFIGLVVGGFVGKFFGNYMITLVGILGTTFLLFPVFLLSMLDNGSMFQPLSVAVFRSISSVPEEWGAYYMKTFMAFGAVQVCWFILLGRTPVLAGIGGFLVPTLIFFTCQQAGVLAHGIAEHLSFEFVEDAKKVK